jgi:hypothetical protein
MLVDIILEPSYADDTRFDASQYAFFGNSVLEEIELGGFEDDNSSNAAFAGLDDLERPLSSQGIALEVGLCWTREIQCQLLIQIFLFHAGAGQVLY